VRLIEILTEKGDKFQMNRKMGHEVPEMRNKLERSIEGHLSDMEVSVKYLQELKGIRREKTSIEVIGQDFRALELQLQGKKVKEIAKKFPSTIRWGRGRRKANREHGWPDQEDD